MTHSLRSFYAPLVSVAAVLGVLVMVTACSSSSSSGGGLSAEESAALAVFAGPGAAEGAQESLPEGDDFDIGDSGSASAAGMRIMASECTETNPPTEGTGTQTVFEGAVATETLTFNNHTVTCPTAQASVDGRIETGESAGRFYGEFGNPGAEDGPFVATVTVDGAPGMSFDMTALVRVCDNCGSTDDGGYSVGGDPEFQAEFYMNALIDVGELSGAFRFGQTPFDPMVFRVWNLGAANETVAMDGRIGVNQSGSPCGFDWVLATQQPVVFQNEQPWNGHVVVSDPDDGSSTYDVVVNDGVITVNGQVITEERQDEIAQQCGFEDEA